MLHAQMREKPESETIVNELELQRVHELTRRPVLEEFGVVGLLENDPERLSGRELGAGDTALFSDKSH